MLGLGFGNERFENFQCFECFIVSVNGNENENEGECFTEGVFTLEGESGGKSLFNNIWK